MSGRCGCPRLFRVVALPAPTAREKSQMYIQRYLPHFPAAGEVVIFDRSWYNRAGVEPVMGFCTPQDTGRFLHLVPGVEKAMADDGPATRCSPRPTPRGRPGTSPAPTTRGAAASTSSATCSARSPTPLPLPDVSLPKRQPAHGYTQPDLPLHYIPAPF